MRSRNKKSMKLNLRKYEIFVANLVSKFEIVEKPRTRSRSRSKSTRQSGAIKHEGVRRKATEMAKQKDSSMYKVGISVFLYSSTATSIQGRPNMSSIVTKPMSFRRCDLLSYDFTNTQLVR